MMMQSTHSSPTLVTGAAGAIKLPVRFRRWRGAEALVAHGIGRGHVPGMTVPILRIHRTETILKRDLHAAGKCREFLADLRRPRGI